MRTNVISTIICGIVLSGATTLQAQLINVDFVGNSVGTAYGGGGVNPGPTMSGAALIGSAGDTWNGISDSMCSFSSYPGGLSASGLALVYANGSPSGVTMTLTADGSYNANEPNWGNTSAFTTSGSPYSDLMQDLIYANVPQSITLSGLAPDATYTLVLYNAGDQNVGTGRTSTFTVNGLTQTSLWDGKTSTLVAGVDYVEYSAATSDVSGNLVIDFGVAGGSGALETDLDGFQLMAVPEPSSLILSVLAGGALFGVRRRLL